MTSVAKRALRQLRRSRAGNAVDLGLDQSLREYWLGRLQQHFGDTHIGVKMLKFPEDLRTYEHIIWSYKPDTVIEIGTQTGGSALWFRDRLRTLQHYAQTGEIRVVSVDLDVTGAHENLAAADPEYAATITLISGDVRDGKLAAEVERALPPRARCLLVEDSAHTYETTSAALRHYSRFVSIDGFFVVEDAVVDVERLRLSEDWPRRVLSAIHDFLASEAGSSFKMRRDMELYGVTSHPQGFLQRCESPGHA